MMTSVADSAVSKSSYNTNNNQNSNKRKRKTMDIETIDITQDSTSTETSTESSNEIDSNKKKNSKKRRKKSNIFSSYAIRKIIKADETLNDFVKFTDLYGFIDLLPNKRKK